MAVRLARGATSTGRGVRGARRMRVAAYAGRSEHEVHGGESRVCLLPSSDADPWTQAPAGTAFCLRKDCKKVQ